jgi:putative tryptophan/tyrosine transport system substrate-binding protein
MSLKRRDFLTVLGGAAAGWPLAARAQQPDRTRRIGVLMAYAEGDREARAWIAAFRQELQKFGWTEDRSLRIEIRWATTDEALLQRFAKELIALQPDLILSSSTLSTAALLRQTRIIPIVFATVADPVGDGFVASFPRPSGNATGFTTVEASMAGKWLELLKEIAPRTARVASIFHPTSTAGSGSHLLDALNTAASVLAVEVISAPVHDMSELEAAVSAQAHEPNGGLILMPGAYMAAHSAEVASLIGRYRLPSIAPYRFYPELGGLLSYGYDPLDNFRRAAGYADRILRGEKPGDLPVQAPTKFELVVNLKTAKALGLDVPWFLQQRADEVIE